MAPAAHSGIFGALPARLCGYDDSGKGFGAHAQYKAASTEGAHYALPVTNKVTIDPGQRVLVHGATGAPGGTYISSELGAGGQNLWLSIINPLLDR